MKKTMKNVSRSKIISVCITLLFFILSNRVFAQTDIYVSPGGSHTHPYTNWTMAATTVWAAVSSANSNDAMDTVWIGNGHYMLDTTIVVSNVKVRGFSGDPADVIVDGAGSVRCFHLKHPNSELSGLTITNGHTGIADLGAGVFIEVIEPADISISNCVITGNTSDSNTSAIHARVRQGGLGYFRLYDSYVVGNSGQRDAIANWWGGNSDWTFIYLYRCHVGDNDGHGVYGAHAGRLYIYDSVIYNNEGIGARTGSATPMFIGGSVITNNSGHGVGFDGIGTPWIHVYDTLISDNGEAGIALSNVRHDSSIRNTEIRNNDRGIYARMNHTRTLTIENTLIADNHTQGGLWINVGDLLVGEGAEVLVRNVTIANNERTAADRPGGVYFDPDCKDAQMKNTFYNTIVYGNKGGDFDDINPSDPAEFFHSCSPDLAEGNGNITNNPVFIDGAGGNYRLRGSSPCIGTGDLLHWTEDDVDLEGNPRVFRGKVDMGCYQHIYRGTFFMTGGL